MIPADAATAVYRDGTSSRKRAVTLRFAEQLQIIEDGTVAAAWPYDDIRRVDGPHRLRVSCVSALPLARLETDSEAVVRELQARCRTILLPGRTEVRIADPPAGLPSTIERKHHGYPK